MAIKVIGSESLQRKLDALGRDAPKAQRWGLAQGARLAVWFLKGAAPDKKKNKYATGATKAAIGHVEQKTPNGYSRWIGIRKKEYVKKMWEDPTRTRILRHREFVVEYKNGHKYMYRRNVGEPYLSPRKNIAEGFIKQVDVVKKPFEYSFLQENKSPWFYPTWRKISGNIVNTIHRKTDERIKQILAKKG